VTVPLGGLGRKEIGQIVAGRGVPRWAALVRGWAAGNTAGRARAAVAVRHRWKDPIWQELVPGLLGAAGPPPTL
jgi:hypothetical protein